MSEWQFARGTEECLWQLAEATLLTGVAVGLTGPAFVGGAVMASFSIAETYDKCSETIDRYYPEQREDP